MKKMSKSTPGENSKIMLSDTPEKAAKKIMSATTDSFGLIEFNLETRPGISNLLNIEALINNRPLEDVVEEWKGKERYGDLKSKVAGSVKNLLENFQQNLDKISNTEIEKLFETGEKYANEIAGKKLREVQEKIGLR